MRTINSNAEQMDHILAHAEKDGALRNVRRRARLKSRDAYLCSEHRYWLKVGDTRTEKTLTMTGKEALIRNRALEQRFIADKNPRARLSRWCMDRQGQDGD